MRKTSNRRRTQDGHQVQPNTWSAGRHSGERLSKPLERAGRQDELDSVALAPQAARPGDDVCFGWCQSSDW